MKILLRFFKFRYDNVLPNIRIKKILLGFSKALCLINAPKNATPLV